MADNNIFEIPCIEYENIKSKDGVQCCLTVERFNNVLSNPRGKIIKEDIPCLILGTLKSGYTARKKENIESLSGTMLDIDGTTQTIRDNILNFFKENNIFHAAYSTWSNKCKEKEKQDSQERFRIILPFSKTYNEEEYKTVADKLYYFLLFFLAQNDKDKLLKEIHLDTCFKDFNRVFYIPAKHFDNTGEYWHKPFSGSILIDIFLNMITLPKKLAYTTTNTQQYTNNNTRTNNNVYTYTNTYHNTANNNIYYSWRDVKEKFDSSYSVEYVLDNYLPDIWEKTSANRYKLIGSNSIAGGVVHDGYFFSHHANKDSENHLHRQTPFLLIANYMFANQPNNFILAADWIKQNNLIF